MYVCNREGPHLALALRPFLIYCASPSISSLLIPHSSAQQCYTTSVSTAHSCAIQHLYSRRSELCYTTSVFAAHSSAIHHLASVAQSCAIKQLYSRLTVVRYIIWRPWLRAVLYNICIRGSELCYATSVSTAHSSAMQHLRPRLRALLYNICIRGSEPC
jgi:hypothetical protein